MLAHTGTVVMVAGFGGSTRNGAAVTVEKHVKYATDRLPNINAAFVFIMEHADEFESPHIEISPMWVYSDTEDGALYYSATIAGNID